MGGGEIAGLQSLAELREKLFEGILRSGGSVRAGGMVMAMMVTTGNGGRLQILLDGCVVLLGSGEIAGFEVGGQLIEGGGKSARGRRGGRRDGREISGLACSKV